MNPLASIGRVHEVVQIVSLDARQDIANQPSRFGTASRRWHAAE